MFDDPILPPPDKKIDWKEVEKREGYRKNIPSPIRKLDIPISIPIIKVNF